MLCRQSNSEAAQKRCPRAYHLAILRRHSALGISAPLTTMPQPRSPRRCTSPPGRNHGSGGLFGYLTSVSAELTEGNSQWPCQFITGLWQEETDEDPLAKEEISECMGRKVKAKSGMPRCERIAYLEDVPRDCQPAWRRRMLRFSEARRFWLDAKD